jgi:hypothetical protein
VLPPLVVDAVLRLATGRCGTGRRPAAACGAWLGLLMAAQIFIAEELLLDAGIAAVIAVTVLAVGRPRAALGRIGDVLYGAAAAVAVAALIAGYALWEQFLGPIRQAGSPFIPDFYKNDLAGFVQPSAAMLLHIRASAAFAAAFQGGSPEYLAYLGWPMLIALAAVAALLWRRPTVRVTAVVFVVLEVLSLGGTLLAGGHEHARIKLPWYWLQTLPVTGSVIPDRFSILADGAAAALFAVANRAAGDRAGGDRTGGAGRHRAACPAPAARRFRPRRAGRVDRGVRGAAAAGRRARSPAAHSGVNVHRAAAVAGGDRGTVLSGRRLLHGPRRQRPGRNRWQRAAASGRVP